MLRWCVARVLPLVSIPPADSEIPPQASRSLQPDVQGWAPPLLPPSRVPRASWQCCAPEGTARTRISGCWVLHRVLGRTSISNQRAEEPEVECVF